MSQSETHVSLWGGRFSGGPSQALAALSVSTHFDFRLAHVDIAGSHAHADELHRVGLLTDQECADMHDALARLDADVASGAFVPAADDEDVHTALERGLIERAGATLGGKLRAGRSRNDQIATLIRVYLREEARHLAGRVLDIAQALVGQAVRAGDAVMPGRTHMQHAQPVLVAHHLLAHVDIAGSHAHADELHRVGLLTDQAGPLLPGLPPRDDFQPEGIGPHGRLARPRQGVLRDDLARSPR